MKASPRFLSRLVVVMMIVSSFAVFMSFGTPVAKAAVQPPIPGPTVNLGTSADVTQALTSCIVGGVIFDVFVDTSTLVVSVFTSTDGTTFTSQPSPYTFPASSLGWSGTCGQASSQYLFVFTMPLSGVVYPVQYTMCTISGVTLTCGAATNIQSSSGGGKRLAVPQALGQALAGVTTFIGNSWYTVVVCHASWACLVKNGINTANLTSGVNSAIGQGGGTFFVVGTTSSGTSCGYAWSSDFITWSTGTFTTAGGAANVLCNYQSSGNPIAPTNSPMASNVQSDAMFFFYATDANGVCAGAGAYSCLEAAILQPSGIVQVVRIAKLSSAVYALFANYDGANFLSVVGENTVASGANFYVYSSTPLSLANVPWTQGVFDGTPFPCGASIGSAGYSTGSEFFTVEGMNACNNTQKTMYSVTFGLANIASTSSSQQNTIGGCPTKNTATFTMANSTIYMYAVNALGQQVVNTVEVDVASITGSGSHTLELVIYVGTQQAISVNAPSTLAFQYTKTFSTGTTNQRFIVQVNIPLNTVAAAPLPFNWWAVGVIGDNKIVLNQSSIAGLQTVTGSAPPANQPLSFTALTSNANKIALCATSSYQSFFSTTLFSTTTQSASTTASFSTTITSTINTIGSQLFSTSSNWPVIFLILLLPAGLFLGVTKNIAGALLGLMIGAIMGTIMGILPGWAFIGIVISLAAIAFISQRRD